MFRLARFQKITSPEDKAFYNPMLYQVIRIALFYMLDEEQQAI